MAKICPNCGWSNREDARFCSSCATSLAQELVCHACGTRHAPTARFCHQCGIPLAGIRSLAGPGTGMLSPQSMLAGRYIIVQKVGQGGMAAVYKATDTRLGHNIVAIKEMSDAAITDPSEKQQARQAFEQEAQMLARLNHPNLPRVTDHFSERGKQYLVMDFIEGQTLEKILAPVPGFLGEKQVVDWGAQLCGVLDYLHSQRPPVIFRDLKPSNIMVDQDGKVKLIDFGIARLFKAGKTTDTVTFGTAGYAPPEQYGKGQTDARSDIYALGATLHHLLTRRDPAQMPFVFPSVRSLNAKVSEPLDRAILRALEQDPARRWPTAREMQDALVSPQPVPPGLLPEPVPISPAASVPAVPLAAARTYVPPVVSPSPISPARPKPVPVRAPAPVVAPFVEFAGFGRRLTAALIDWFILFLFVGLLAFLAEALSTGSTDETVLICFNLLALIGSLGYFTYFHARSGQTPGKKMTGIKVISADGSPLSTGKSVARTFGYLLTWLLTSVLLGYLGFLWMLWDQNKQTWHDKMASTYVIKI